jgi:hypothetical protein
MLVPNPATTNLQRPPCNDQPQIFKTKLAEPRNQIIATIIGFYLLLFRHTIYKAHGEIRKARQFVLMMPFYILPPEDVEFVVDFFKNGEQDMDDMDLGEIFLSCGTRVPTTVESTVALVHVHHSLGPRFLFLLLGNSFHARSPV